MKKIGVIILLIFTTLLFSCVTTPTGSSSEDELLQRIVNFYTSVNDVNEAIEYVESYDIEKLSDETRNFYTALLITAGQQEKADTQAQIVLTNDPENLKALYNMALIEMLRGNDAKRDYYINKGFDIDPNDVDFNILKADILIQDDKYNEANSFLTVAINQEPDHFQAIITKSKVLMHLSTLNEDMAERYLEEAIRWLTKAESIQDDYAYIYSDRARAYIVLEEYRLAEDDLNRAIELEPDVEWHYIDRARINLKYFDDKDSALADLLVVEELNPNNFFAMVYLAGIYEEKDLIDQSLEYYKKVADIKPEYYYTYESLAKIYFIQEDWQNAAVYFLKAYEEYQQDWGYPIMASIAMRKMGDHQNATQLLEDVARTIERDTIPYELYRVFITLGSESFALDKINRSEPGHLKYRGEFYIGQFYLLEDLESSAMAILLNPAKRNGSFEYQIAKFQTGEVETNE